ncbi:hypothetical protein J8L85_12340 [Maribacter sp. MMG018]|uniref:hypothetical protein n=1 Tax=Maribacter sp. MMG018 TaxID=2822688 RepID=UPI001B389400|nr:hypothetical protein [Maribacter sp. MMG018]MBQ4915234.1 hypothetical protein [Maribacter sp. MMG018]
MVAKTFLKTLSFIHLSLVIGLLAVTGIILFQGKGFSADTNGDDIFLYIVPIISIIGYFGGQFLFNRSISKINREQSMKEKLTTYTSASLVKYACIEGPAIICLVAYYSTGNALPLTIAFCLMAFLIVQRPSKHRIIGQLPLTPEEKKEFQ